MVAGIMAKHLKSQNSKKHVKLSVRLCLSVCLSMMILVICRVLKQDAYHPQCVFLHIGCLVELEKTNGAPT
jgi:hypothetical protein